MEELGEWNEMIAAAFGGLKDAMGDAGVVLQSPISNYANFEQLEFRGQKQKQLVPFLKAMKGMVDHLAEATHKE